MDADDARTLRGQLQALQRRQRREWTVVAGLSPTVVRVLGAIARGDATHPGELAGLLHMATPNVAAALRELEAHGYVEGQRDATDRRRVNLSLTERGRALVDEHRAMRVEWLQTAIEATLDEREQELLVAAGRLLERVAAHEGHASERAVS